MLQKEAAAQQSEAAKAKQKATPDANAQQPSAAQPQGAAAPQAEPQAEPRFTLPAGTKIPLGLLRPLSLKSRQTGSDVYLQITFPVAAGSQVLIPPGAYIQAVISKNTRDPNHDILLEFQLTNASLIFPTGYTVPISGVVSLLRTSANRLPATLPDGQPVRALTAADTTARRTHRAGTVAETAPSTADRSDGSGLPAPAMSAVGAVAPPTLPPLPSLGNGPRNALIGIGVGLGVVAVVGIALAASHHGDVRLETGTPLEMVLLAPLQLDPEHVIAAVQQYSTRSANAPQEIVQPPKRPRMCYDPGSPGTSDTVIPGSPGTPPTVIPGMNGMPDIVIPGTPATPDTVIPGSPGTPGSWYACPR